MAGAPVWSSLERSRYWTSAMGPPRDDVEDLLAADLRTPRYAPQRRALAVLQDSPMRESELRAIGVTVRSLQDLRVVGLVLSGLDANLQEKTFRRSALGRIVNDLVRGEP